MGYSFDKIIDRRGSGAYMTDSLKERYGREDLIPLWIADMNFETPAPVREALEKRLAHQVYGYTGTAEHYWQTLIDWERRIHGWEIAREAITFIPGIVRGIAFVLHCFTDPGDKVVVQPPVYMPFLNLPRANGRQLVYNPLIFDETAGTYRMDLEHLAQVCRTEKPRLLILSNPHNPAGVVWPAEDLARLAAICQQEGVLVISDEIHADMTLGGHVHHPFPTVSETAATVSVTFAAPSKTFNIPGIVSSFCVVPNPEIRLKFYGFQEANELNATMFLSTVATEAAFTQCDDWRREMLSYVQENVEYVCHFIETRIPGIRAVRPQASFLIWLDCHGLGLGHDALIDLFVNQARLALNDGEAFGPGGEGHMRMNVAAPRAVLTQALTQLEAAVKSLKN